ncbi:ferric reductase-like transmembrane domain-containing protein [Nonomuraea gerenzanensis]|uniref:Oxidoreductase n=1 Tax=Nonomuraea gerenzanensis TaxID=93944 RepID=A0A1M4E8P6_9ACTN|nr:ferric reductase-like transmembrane domain-containing protein [Nonomuraea gerenzanensis]UBU17372.1 ferric reductase-like transmembrane domain-containing protein [Nonomuraea gerenzanensis]SBO95122.1 oxidoreductase [Nonomuraea gerenzanensis]
MRRVAIAVAVSFLPLLPLALRASDLGDVANLIGLAGTIVMWWQVLLGVRQLAHRLGDDRLAAVSLHRWLGGCGAFLVLLHPLLETVVDRQDWAYVLVPDFTWAESAYASLGRLAFLMFLVLWVTSTLARYLIRHRVWRYAHYVSYPLLALVFVHSWGLGSFLTETPWLLAYWLVLAVVFAGVVCWRLSVSRWAVPYRLVGVERLSPTVRAYTFRPLGRALDPLPGQFCYLRTSLASRAHPFSVVSGGAELTFAVKDAGSFTERLRALEPGAVVHLDGPYGTFTREAQDGPRRPAVLIAGGIGVTPFVELVRRNDDLPLSLVHVVASPQEAVFGAELRHRLGDRYQEVVRPERPAIPVTPRARYFICGSPRFVETTAAGLRGSGARRDQLYTERFDC